MIVFSGSALADRAFVSNEKDNTVSVIDTDTRKVVKTVKVGQRPRGIILAKDGKWLLVAASDDSRIEVYDTETYKLVKYLSSGEDPELFALHPDGKHIYIANEDDNLVTVVNIDTNKIISEIPVGVEPEGIGMSPDGKTVVNTSETTNMAHFINTTTNKIEHNVLVDQRPRVAAFTADGSQLWVSSEIGGTVSVIDVATHKIIKKISFAVAGITPETLQPVGIQLTKDGSKAFVALGPANRVAAINAKTFEVEKYILVGQRVWNLAFTLDEKFLMTTNGTSNDVTFIDVAKLRGIKSVKTGRYPWGIVVGK
ncbi:MAG: YVTN family beta-propeller repeat protein [Hyphomicrobiaceae bacterium]